MAPGSRAAPAFRPRTLDLLPLIFEEVTELHGDRLFGDDPAIVGGPALLDGHPVMVIGHQKGNDTETNIERNFGSAHPEGFRKAQRLMRLAEKLGMPLITFLDTAGADPGAGAEERGQAEAIASSIKLMTELQVPIVVVILGEGGSGGALALGVGDEVLALENSVYSVISPEGCAAILWRSPDDVRTAAAAMRMTARRTSSSWGGGHHDCRAGREGPPTMPPRLAPSRRQCWPPWAGSSSAAQSRCWIIGMLVCAASAATRRR